MVMTFILDVDLDLETHLIPHVEIAYKIYIIHVHMVLNKFNQIIVENDLHIASKC